jgi:lysozyme family protein
MANFEVFLPLILKFEGGFVDDPSDPGGATNKGITFKTFCGCSQKLLNVDPTLDNLKALTDTQVGAIYRANYWNSVSGDAMALQDLANLVCDFYINAGVNAGKLLQTVMNEMGCKVTVDGAIGPETMRALAALDQAEVYRRYKAGRIAYYEHLVQQEPALGKFLHGWINRVNSFPDLQQQAAGGSA